MHTPSDLSFLVGLADAERLNKKMSFS